MKQRKRKYQVRPSEYFPVDLSGFTFFDNSAFFEMFKLSMACKRDADELCGIPPSIQAGCTKCNSVSEASGGAMSAMV